MHRAGPVQLKPLIEFDEMILVTETGDRIRHVEMLNIFLENLFPGDSNVTEYGYEFEKNIFKTQAAKSYIYPS